MVGYCPPSIVQRAGFIRQASFVCRHRELKRRSRRSPCRFLGLTRRDIVTDISVTQCDFVICPPRRPLRRVNILDVPLIMLEFFLLLSGLSTSITVWLILQVYAWLLRRANITRRQSILQQLGIPPTEPKKLIGFFHPYWQAGISYVKKHHFPNSNCKIVMLAVVVNVYYGPQLPLYKEMNRK